MYTACMAKKIPRITKLFHICKEFRIHDQNVHGTCVKIGSFILKKLTYIGNRIISHGCKKTLPEWKNCFTCVKKEFHVHFVKFTYIVNDILHA